MVFSRLTMTPVVVVAAAAGRDWIPGTKCCWRILNVNMPGILASNAFCTCSFLQQFRQVFFCTPKRRVFRVSSTMECICWLNWIRHYNRNRTHFYSTLLLAKAFVNFIWVFFQLLLSLLHGLWWEKFNYYVNFIRERVYNLYFYLNIYYEQFLMRVLYLFLTLAALIGFTFIIYVFD